MGVTRRDLLMNTGKLATGIAAGMPARKAVAADQPSPGASTTRKLKVIVCGGHPGDPEYGCGGIIARLTKGGHHVSLLYLNEGDWPPTSAATRLAEAKKACEILGCRRLYAGQKNGHAIVDKEHYEHYLALLEKEQPDAVFTQWPIDNHRDHRACWTLTYDAWQKMEKKFTLYYYEVSNGEDTLQFSPTHYLDISEEAPMKRAACYAHASQSPDRYYAVQDEVARFRGLESGFTRAEAFVMQVQSPCDVLGMALLSCSM